MTSSPPPRVVECVVSERPGYVPMEVLTNQLSLFFFFENQRLANRVKLVREIVKEVAGLAPYEKRIAELLRIGKDKRALKYAKQKLGTHVRGKRKREEIAEILRKTRK